LEVNDISGEAPRTRNGRREEGILYFENENENEKENEKEN
jgi:hypothetical protein